MSMCNMEKLRGPQAGCVGMRLVQYTIPTQFNVLTYVNAHGVHNNYSLDSPQGLQCMYNFPLFRM